jgi:hypothetical protein
MIHQSQVAKEQPLDYRSTAERVDMRDTYDKPDRVSESQADYSTPLMVRSGTFESGLRNTLSIAFTPLKAPVHSQGI